MRIKILFFLFLILCISGVNAQSVVSGTVYDKSSGEALPGATLLFKPTKTGMATDLDGKFSITLPNSSYTIETSYMGYKTEHKELNLTKNIFLKIELEPISEELQTVEITDVRSNKNIVNNVMGKIDVSIEAIKNIPTLLGEADIIKAIQLLPGVMSTQEGGSGFIVRGGAPDQNLIILDDATVYNASHALGFFSVFNNDAIKDVSIYKGDIPLQFGGRLSSLLDITMDEGNNKKIEGAGGVGLLSSRLALKGKINDTRYMVAGRRTYFDLLFPLANNDQLDGTSLYFWDINAKVSQTLSKTDRISMSFYTGLDRFVMGQLDMKMNYGNTAGSLIWSHLFSQKLNMKLGANFSIYDYNMRMALAAISAEWWSKIIDGGLKLDFAYIDSEDLAWHWGVSSIYHTFYPGESQMSMNGFGEWISDSASVGRLIKFDPVHALENAVYVSNDININEHIQLKYGLRFSTFSNIGKDKVYYYDKDFNVTKTVDYKSGDFYHTNYGLEPRIGANFIIDETQSIKANYSRTIQYLQLAQNSSMGLPIDVWFPTNPNIKPQTADMFSVGYFKNLFDNEFETSAEIYYKHINNNIDFKEHSSVIMNEQLYGEIRTGIGRGYGLELMVKKASGKLNGWISYTLSRAERKVSAINQGKWYLSPYDKTHNFTVVFNYDFAPRHSVSANWVYYTGNATTFPSGKAYINGMVVPVYTERNGYRMPDYHRLDVSYTFKSKPSKKFQWDINVGCYNIYNKHNAWMILFQQEGNRSYSEMMYLFGIVPSITFNFKF